MSRHTPRKITPEEREKLLANAKLNQNLAQLELCIFCGEPVDRSDVRVDSKEVHRECALRSVMGGIGHHLDHAYFCSTKQDPDAGLDYRTSALLVDVFVSRLPKLNTAIFDEAAQEEP